MPHTIIRPTNARDAANSNSTQRNVTRCSEIPNIINSDLKQREFIPDTAAIPNKYNLNV